VSRVGHPRWTALLAGTAALGVYLLTLSPSISWGDSAELTAAAYTAGVPHPTGYPAYMLLGFAFLRGLPFASPAYQMNLLSALAAAAGAGFAALLLWEVTRSRAAALLGALLFAFSRTFWSQAVVTEVYALHVCLATGVLGLLLAWDRTGRRGYLLAAAAVYGLAFANHLSAVLLAPGLLVFALTGRRRSEFARALRWTVPLFLLPLTLYLYLPLRAMADPPLNWGDPRTLKNFLDLVTGREFQQMMGRAGPDEIWRGLVRYAGPGGFLLTQWAPWLLLLAPVGMVWLRRRRPRVLALTLLIWAAGCGYAVSYQIPDLDAYYLVPHLMTAVWMACAVPLLRQWLRAQARVRALAPGALAVIIPWAAAYGNWGANDRHEDWSPLAYGRVALESLKPDAVVVVGAGQDYFPMFYARYVENRRPDVTFVHLEELRLPSRLRLTTRLRGAGLVVNIPSDYPVASPGVVKHGALLANIVRDNLGRRPVYVFFLVSPEWMVRSSWIDGALRGFHPVLAGNMWLLEVLKEPPAAPVPPADPSFQPIAYGRALPGGGLSREIELLSYHAEPMETDGAHWLRLRYHWRVHGPVPPGLRVTAILSDSKGTFPAEADGQVRFHNAHALGQEAVRSRRPLPPALIETFDVHVPPALRGREVRLNVGLETGEGYLASSAGKPVADVGLLPTLPPFP